LFKSWCGRTMRLIEVLGCEKSCNGRRNRGCNSWKIQNYATKKQKSMGLVS
jgi:hypothetical protein